jgi:hypothetical protein
MSSAALLSPIQVAAALLLAAGGANSASKDDPAVSAAFQRELAACQRIADPDAHRTCRREAYAARDEARHGTLAEGADFERNKLARCEAHKDAAERDYCLRRMRGEGTVSGSVEGGGLLRELRVIVPAE